MTMEFTKQTTTTQAIIFQAVGDGLLLPPLPALMLRCQNVVKTRLNWKSKSMKLLQIFIIAKVIAIMLDWRQCGNSLALCYFAVVMELPDS